jgi:hypothetical protein
MGYLGLVHALLGRHWSSNLGLAAGFRGGFRRREVLTFGTRSPLRIDGLRLGSVDLGGRAARRIRVNPPVRLPGRRTACSQSGQLFERSLARLLLLTREEQVIKANEVLTFVESMA